MWDKKRKRFKPEVGGRPARPRRGEKIQVMVPFDLLDLVEDLSHQLYWERSKFIVEAIRLGAKKMAALHGLEYDRLDKVTYRDRSKRD